MSILSRLSPNALAFRLVAGALVWILLSFVVGGLVLTQVFRGAVERALDERLGVIMDNVLADLDVDEDGAIALKRRMGDARFERVYSGWYWQLDRLGDPNAENIARPSVRSRSLWDEKILLPDPPPARGLGRSYVDGPDGQRLRVLERRIALPGVARPLRLAVAAEISGMHAEINAFTRTLGQALAAMAVVLAVSLVLQVRLALAPLAKVREGLAAVRDGRAERLSGRFPTEIAPLADELNRVLDHNRDVVERARTQVGNLAHALKTPLSVLKTTADRHDGPLADAVTREAVTMRKQVDHYLSRARMAASAEIIGARTPLRPVILDLLRTLERLNPDRAISTDVTCAEDLAVRGERADLEDMVGNLLDNAFKWAAQTIRIEVSRQGQQVVLTIGDDGPGLDEDQREAALKRGVRLDETVPGSGLGLAIVDDIATAHRGALALDRSALGGLEARLCLPLA